MKSAVTVANMLTRLTGLIQIVLGILFWTGHATSLIPVHILSGTVLVLSLWTLAFLATRAGVRTGLVVLALIWGLITVILGMAQSQILVNSAHWIIQVVHLLVGLGAIGQAEGLAVRIKRAHLPETAISGQAGQPGRSS
ncbi:MAG: hypothetical protein P4L50_07265 [Anaerolineaceae bacterium]|nr:hypothetical protein [Anaerolineaceae bacterium]